MLNVQPIDMISAPNVFKPIDTWHIIGGNTKTLWLQLVTEDSLGERRYLPANGSVLRVIFERRPELSPNTIRGGALKQTIQTVEKIAIKSEDMYHIDLTSADTTAILSGTVKFTLTESGRTQTWVQNWLITKELTDPGY